MEYKSSSVRPEVDLAALFDDVIRFETELWDLVDAELRRTHGLPLSWFEPMAVVRRTPNCRVADIADALSITVGGTSKLIDRISAAGLLMRTPHPDDGRSSIIALTDDGQQMLDAAGRTFSEALDERLGGVMSPRRLEQFATTIRQLRRSLRDQPRSA